MARCIHRTARKPQGNCRTCRKPIEAGQQYKKWNFRYRGTLKLHEDCAPRRSWLTGSEILGTLWDLVDDYTPEGDTPEEIADSLREFAQQVEDDVVEGIFQEKLDNMEGAGTGLENTPVYEDLQSRQEEVRSWVEAMQSTADEIAEAEPDECNCEEEWQAEQEAEREQAEAEGDEPPEEEPWDGTHSCGAEEYDADSLREQAAGAAGECPE